MIYVRCCADSRVANVSKGNKGPILIARRTGKCEKLRAYPRKLLDGYVGVLMVYRMASPGAGLLLLITFHLQNASF